MSQSPAPNQCATSNHLNPSAAPFLAARMLPSRIGSAGPAALGLLLAVLGSSTTLRRQAYPWPLAGCFYLLHHAPGDLATRPISAPCPVVLLLALRVHVEPRPPDFEESSQFSRAAAGKDGLCQARRVGSPPPLNMLALTMAQERRRARHWRWADRSGSCEAPQSDCMPRLVSGAGQLLTRAERPLMADCRLE